MKRMFALMMVLSLIICSSGCGSSNAEDPTIASRAEEGEVILSEEAESNAHEHDWIDATCTEPKTCSVCGETEGEPLGHKWEDATCTEPKTCSACGEIEGSPLGHQWILATCTEPKYCSVCKETDGQALGHKWDDATCTEPKTCSVCGETDGEPLGHQVSEWTVTTESNCLQEGEQSGTCDICGRTVIESLPKTDHAEGVWYVSKEPTEDEAGEWTLYCPVCGETLETQVYELSAEQIEQNYKDKCYSYSYDNISRRPGDYEGYYITYSGYVVQVCSEASSPLYYSTYRVATSGKYDDVVYLKVDNYGSNSRILEDDYITFYGTYDGIYTYKTVLGASISIPSITAKYVD